MAVDLETPDTRQEQDEAHNPSQEDYNRRFNDATGNQASRADNLKKLEDSAHAPSSANDDKHTADETPSKNIDQVKEQEANSPGSINYVPGEKKVKRSFRGDLAQKGPLFAIISLLLTGVGGFGLLSNTALMQLKANVVNKLESISSVVEERGYLNLEKRMFGTSATCRIKAPSCKYKGLTQRQYDRLTIQGAQMLDADGNPVTKNFAGYYTGGRTLVTASGKRFDAATYRKGLRTASEVELRTLSRSVFAARFWSFNDKISKDIRAKKKLVSNPDLGEENNDKETRKKFSEAISGQGATVTADPAHGTNPDGSAKPNPIDLGESAEDINSEVTKLQAAAAAGDIIPELTSDPAEVMTLAEVKSGSALKSALGFLNPADFLVGLCNVYQFAHISLITSILYENVNNMRAASLVLSSTDKVMAGDGSSSDVTKLMNIMQTPDSYGDAFGDAFMFGYTTYGVLPDKPLTASANGNEVIRILSQSLKSVDNALGGRAVVITGCGLITNPFVQGALSLTSFIPGSGALTSGAGKVFSGGLKLAAEKFIKDQILAKITKDGLKNAGRTATNELRNFATKGPAALFVSGYMLNRYGIPYIARTMTGADLINPNGVKLMDATGSGFAGINAATGMERGLPLLTKNGYKAAYKQFNDESTATYIADMRSQSKPFDLNDPYSAGSTFVAAYYPLLSHLGFLNTPSRILSLPTTILASLNPTKFMNDPVLADDSIDAQLAYCDDDFKQSHNLATQPDCNLIPGFNDVAMLKETDPDQVRDWLRGGRQIDDQDKPIPGSKYEKYIQTCIVNSSDKVVGDVGEEDMQLSPECYGEASETLENKMFRLGYIDNGNDEIMDNPPIGE